MANEKPLEKWEDPRISPDERARLYLLAHPNLSNKANLKSGYGINSIANSINLYGFQHRKIKALTSLPMDNQGFVFFTRPDLRLTYDNLVQDRFFSLMLNSTRESVWAWARATLDPRGSRIYDSDKVDVKNPFIPFLTNNLKSLSGWNELSVDAYTTDAGLYNEAQSHADGFAKDYGVRQLTATFENQVGDPVNKLFDIWTKYSMYVHEGVMDPYIENLVLNIVDYNTRIYRIVLDPYKRYIQHIGACGAAFPLNSQNAANFDYNSDEVKNKADHEVSIQFQTMGHIYDDPILMFEFNSLVNAFCPEIGAGKWVRLEMSELKLFSNEGIPFINLNNGALHWYMDPADYHARYDYLDIPNNERPTPKK